MAPTSLFVSCSSVLDRLYWRVPFFIPTSAVVIGLVAAPLFEGVGSKTLLGAALGIVVARRQRISLVPWVFLIFFFLGLARGVPPAHSVAAPLGSVQLWELSLARPQGPGSANRWSAWATAAYSAGPRRAIGVPEWKGRIPIDLWFPSFWSSEIQPARGERWLVRGRLREGRYAKRGDPARLRVASVSHGARVARDSSVWLRWMQRWDSAVSRLQHRVARGLDQGAPASVRGLFVALVLGDRTGLSSARREAFARSGTAHLLAISGLHVAVVAVVLMDGLRRLVSVLLSVTMSLGFARVTPSIRAGGWHWVASVIGVVGAVIYVAIAGAPVSAVRALLMLVLVVLARVLERRASGWNALSAAVLAIVWADPRALFQLGFQLSVISVAGLLSMGPRPIGAIRRTRIAGLAYGLWNCAVASAVATVVTAPLAALTWGRVAIAGLWVNPLAVPLLSVLCMPPLLVGAALGAINPNWSDPILRLAAIPASGGLTWVEWASRSEHCPILLGAPSPWLVGALYGSSFLVLALAGLMVAAGGERR